VMGKRATGVLARLLIGWLVLIGVGASASFYFREPANTQFANYPIMTALHVGLGGVYMLLAPFQFLPSIRNRWINYHRQVGRFLVGVGVIVGLTAAFMAVVIPYSGWSERIFVTPFTIYFGFCIFRGFRLIRQKRIKEHKEWMTRGFAIGLAISTQRLLFLPPLLYIIFRIGAPTEEQIVLLTIVSFVTALVSHALIAEWWIRRQARNGLL